MTVRWEQQQRLPLHAGEHAGSPPREAERVRQVQLARGGDRQDHQSPARAVRQACQD